MTRARRIAAVAAARAAPARSHRSKHREQGDRLWALLLAIVAVSLVAVLWYPLLRINALPSFNYNEGWNAYRQWMTVEGRPLYARPPMLSITNYPFLSFHLVGLFGAAIGNVVLAGRITSLLGMIATAALTGATVRAMSGSVRGGVYAGLCLLLWIATLTPERRATNDPSLLGAAFVALGLFAYVKAATKPRWLVLSAAAFAVGVFTKQDLLSVPIGVGVHLLLTKRPKPCVLWVGVGGASCVLLLGLTYRLDGPFFLAHLLRPRAYQFRNLGDNALQYLLHLGAPLAAGATLLIRDRETRDRGLPRILLVVTHGIALLFAGGDGVASNIFYPPMIALAVSLAAAARATGCPAGENRRRRIASAALIVSALAGAVAAVFVARDDVDDQRHLPAVAQAARQMVALLTSADGPAICEDLLLCYMAGKPLGYDPFFVNDQIAINRLPQGDVLAMLRGHRFAAVQIGPTPRAAMHRRFGDAFIRALHADYRLVFASGAYEVFEPPR